MMQYRLSTLFLIFFVVAASLAAFRAWGIWFSVVLLLAAISLNLAKDLSKGILLASFLIFLGIVCPGLISPDATKEAARCACCNNNMKTLEIGLHFYHDSQRHYPSVYTCGKDGKPLFSWIVPLLPKMEYDTVFDALKLDEPWNSPHNAKILSGFYIGEFLCPSVDRTNNNIYSSYVAVIGPGTIWRKEGTVKLSDLPHKGSQTVAVVEVADSGKHHWAEPFAVTVNEVLENMRTGKGVRISSFHPAGVHILFADGSVRCLPCKMPLLLWRKILEGELLAEDLDAIKSRIHSNASDMVDVYVGPTERSSTTIPGVIVWLVSIVLLFYRAVKSRKPNIEPTPLAS